jgi:hypothetical protein
MSRDVAAGKIIAAAATIAAISAVAVFIPTIATGAVPAAAAVGSSLLATWIGRVGGPVFDSKLSLRRHGMDHPPANNHVAWVVEQAAIDAMKVSIEVFAKSQPTDRVSSQFVADLRRKADSLKPLCLSVNNLIMSEANAIVATALDGEPPDRDLAQYLVQAVHALLVPKADLVPVEWRKSSDDFLRFLVGDAAFPGGFNTILTDFMKQALETDERFFRATVLKTLAEMAGQTEAIGNAIAALGEQIAALQAAWLEARPARQDALSGLFRTEIARFERNLAENIKASFESDRAPSLIWPQPSAASDYSLLYWFQSFELVGRDKALAALDQFLDAPGEILWTVVSGPAGVGKSRLLFDFLRPRRDIGLIEAGFLDHKSGWLEGKRYEMWNAPEETVLVIDYAGLSTDSIRDFLDDLANRPPARALTARVRLILIDTLPYDSEAGVRRRIIERGEAGARAARAEWPGDRTALNLGGLDRAGLLRVVAHYAGRALSDAEITQIDSSVARDPELARPLFAALAGLVVQEHIPGLLSTKGVTEHFLARHRERWAERGISDIEHRLLAAATIAGSCPEAVLDDPDLDAQDRDGNVLIENWSIMTGAAWPGRFDKLEPDFVGGLYVLQYITGREPARIRQAEAERRMRPVMRLAWHHGQPGEFLTNLAQNFGGDPDYASWVTTLALYQPDQCTAREHRADWAATVSAMIFPVTLRQADAQADRLLSALAAGADDPMIRPHYASGIFSAGLAGEFPFHPLTDNRLALLRDLATKHSDDAVVREEFAKGLFNAFCRAGLDIERTGALLVELRNLARDYPGDALVRKSLASGLFNAFNDAGPDNVRAKSLLAELRSIAAEHPGDATVRGKLAKGLVNALTRDGSDILQLLVELRSIAAEHSGDLAVQEELANGLANAVCLLGSDAGRADSLLVELRSLAVTHRGDVAFRVCLATGLYNALSLYNAFYHAGSDAGRADSLLVELRDLTTAHPGDAAIRKRLAMGLFNTLYHTGSDAERADALLEELRGLATAHPGEAAVRESLAKGLFNAFNHAGLDAVRADALLAELRGLAVAYPGEAAVREWLAKGLFNAVYHAGSDAARADALLAELRGLATAHPGDAVVQDVLALALRLRSEWSGGDTMATGGREPIVADGRG